MKQHPSLHRFALAATTIALCLGVATLRANTLTWNNPSGGNWNVPGNWTPAQVPGAGDTAMITAPGTYIVIVSDPESAANLTVGAPTGTQILQINSGGVLNDAGGTLSGTGVIQVASGASLNISSTFSILGPLTNSGTMNLTNATLYLFNNNSAADNGGINNQGVINFYGGLGDHIGSTFGSEYLINQGTINQQAAAGTSSIIVFVGALAGTYNASVGTTIQFTGGNASAPLTVATPPVLNGPGQYQFINGYVMLNQDLVPNLAMTGGTLELGPSFQQSGAITNLTLGAISLASGPYQVNGTLRATGSIFTGALTINSGGVLDDSGGEISGSGSVVVAVGGVLNVASTFTLSGPVTNSGTMNLTNATVNLYNINTASDNGGIDNLGVINFYGGLGDRVTSEFGFEYFINEGTITQQAGAGTSSINAFSGALQGTYNASIGTVLQFVGGSVGAPLVVGTPPVLNGPGQYQFVSGYIQLTQDMIPNLALTGGTLELGSSFQENGAITNLTLGTITLTPGAYQVSGTLRAAGSTLSGAIMVNSGGTLDASGGEVSGAGSLNIAPGGILNASSSLTLSGPVTNAGTMNLTNTTLNLYNNNTASYNGGIDNLGVINFYGVNGDHINSELGFEYLINQGAINQQTGTGTSSINAFFGVLTGTYNASLNTLLQFNCGTIGSPLMVGAPPVLNGPGQYQFTSGYLLLTVDAVSNLALVGGTLELGPSFQEGGTITNLALGSITLAPAFYAVSGTLQTAGSTLNGALTINNGGVWNDSGGELSGAGWATIAGGGTLYVSSSLTLLGPLTNSGTINLTNSTLNLYNNNTASYNGGIDNLGAINFYGASGDHITSQLGNEYLLNQGTINQQAGTGTSSINASFDALTGTYNASLNTTLQFSGGNAGTPLAVGTPPLLNGPGQYQFNAGDLLLTVDMVPNLALTGGTLELASSFQQGGAITNLTLDGITLAPGAYAVNGTMRTTNSTLNGAIMVNGGGVLDASGSQISGAGSLTVAVGGVFNLSSSLTLEGPLTNAGTMNMTNASLGLYNNNTPAYLGGIDNLGAINFYGASGDHITYDLGSEYLINQGIVIQRPGTGNSTVSVPQFTDPGTLEVEEGILTLNQLPLQSSSILSFGLNSATDYGKVAVQSSTVLAGTVALSFNNNYVPTNGAQFNVLSGTALAGTFATVAAPAGASASGVYGSTAFSLLITGDIVIMPPLLTIERNNADTITVSWPTSSGNFNLQTSSALSTATWSDITTGIATVGANYVWTYTTSGGAAFFRLRSQ